MSREGIKDSIMIVRWLLLGVLIAASVLALISIHDFQTYFSATLSGLLITLTIAIATMLEICSEGSTPIDSDILTRANASGNIFAFLMTGVSTYYTEIISLRETTGS